MNFVFGTLFLTLSVLFDSIGSSWQRRDPELPLEGEPGSDSNGHDNGQHLNNNNNNNNNQNGQNGHTENHRVQNQRILFGHPVRAGAQIIEGQIYIHGVPVRTGYHVVNPHAENIQNMHNNQQNMPNNQRNNRPRENH